MRFPMLKPRESFQFKKNNHHKKVLFAQGLFFRSSELNYRKKWNCFWCKYPIMQKIMFEKGTVQVNQDGVIF